MKVLIVEDDAFKSRQIELAVSDIKPDSNVVLVSSLSQAMEQITRVVFDAVLLDMAIPSHPSDDGSADIYSQPVGGLDILLHLALENRREKVMVLTQYPTVEYNREHVHLAKLQTLLQQDGIANLSAIALFEEDGAWKGKLLSFLTGDL